MAQIKEKIVNLEDLKTAMQLFYDMVYPVNKIVIQMPGEDAPKAPNGITATWKDVSGAYTERYFKVDSANPAGTLLAESATIKGTTLTVDQIPSHAHGCSENGWHQHYREGYWTVSYTGDTKRECVSRYQSAGGSIDYDNGAGTHSHTIKKEGGGKPHIHEIELIKPTSVTVKVWRRVA